MQIDTEMVKHAWQQYGNLAALAHVSLAEMPICATLRWEGDEGALIGYSVQAVLTWAVERLGAQGGKTKPENAKILINRFVFGHSIAESADLHNKDAEYIKRRTRTAWKQTANIIIEEAATLHNHSTRQTWICEERFAALGQRSQQLLKFMAVFDRPIPPTYLIYHDNQLPHLLDANVVRQHDGRRVQIHPCLVDYVRGVLTLDELHDFYKQAGDLYANDNHVLLAATHWQTAGKWKKAANLLIANRDKLGDFDKRHALDRWQTVLQGFDRYQLSKEQQAQIELMLGNVAKLTKAPLPIALDAYQRALLSAETTATKAEIYFERGDAYREHDVDQAIAQFQQCCNLYQDPTASYWVIKSQQRLAWIYRTQCNNSAEAVRWLDKVEAALTDQAGPKWDGLRADWHNTWSEHHKYEQNTEQSLWHSQQAVIMAERSQDRLRLVKMTFQLGAAYYKNGLPERARAELQRCDQWAAKMRYDVMRGKVQQVWGALEFDQEQFDEAVRHYQLASDAFEQAGERRSQAAMQYNQAEALFEAGQAVQAIGLMARGHALAKASGNQNLRDIFEPQLRRDYVEAREGLNERQRRAIWFARNHDGKIKNKQYQDLNNCARKTAERDLNALVDLGIVVKGGKGRGAHYSIIGNQ